MIEQMERYSHFCKMAQIVHPSYTAWLESFNTWLKDKDLQALYNETEGD